MYHCLYTILHKRFELENNSCVVEREEEVMCQVDWYVKVGALQIYRPCQHSPVEGWYVDGERLHPKAFQFDKRSV